MWNFCGRQNDIQGNGELEHGNWITGIPFIDNAMYGDQSLLPDELKAYDPVTNPPGNKGHNVYYGLPFFSVSSDSSGRHSVANAAYSSFGLSVSCSS